MSDLADAQFTDILQVQGVKAKGYGFIPRLVMQDRRLTVEAKAIYAYFASYDGDETALPPGKEKVCKDLNLSARRYYRHFSLLLEYDYISVTPGTARNKSGRSYMLNEFPKQQQS